MTKTVKTLCSVLFAASLFVAAVARLPAHASSVSQDPAPATTEEEAAKIGEDTTVRVCTECHEFDQVVGRRRTPLEWKDMVTSMANKGANATNKVFATIRDYLT